MVMSTRMLLSPWPLAGAMVKTMAINPKPYTLVMVRTKVKKNADGCRDGFGCVLQKSW